MKYLHFTEEASLVLKLKAIKIYYTRVIKKAKNVNIICETIRDIILVKLWQLEITDQTDVNKLIFVQCFISLSPCFFPTITSI